MHHRLYVEPNATVCIADSSISELRPVFKLLRIEYLGRREDLESKVKCVVALAAWRGKSS